jgi:quinol monooxygenase YgiN
MPSPFIQSAGGKMVIVGGTFEIDPNDRERFLTGRLEMMRASRTEAGCLEYTFAADPIDPSRVVLFERWESQEALDAHLSALRAGPQSAGSDIPTITSSIVIYDVSGERPLGG